MSDYHKAREQGYALAESLVLAMEASVPAGLTGYRRACWLDAAYGAACAVTNSGQRAAFAATSEALIAEERSAY